MIFKQPFLRNKQLTFIIYAPGHNAVEKSFGAVAVDDIYPTDNKIKTFFPSKTCSLRFTK